MLHHFRLDFIDKIIRTIKNSQEPFGGMQVIFCGDFFQLSPVSKFGEPESLFVYHSETWKNLGLKICYLSEQHRQNDSEFLEVLNTIRENRVSEKTKSILQTRFSPKSDFGLEPTKLYSHNKNVDSENELELSKLSGKISEYKMQTRGNRNLVETLKKSCLAPEILELKEGAKVMFIKNNFDIGYVNGTLGIVTKCGYEQIEVKTLSGKIIKVERESWRIEEEGKAKAEITQYPLRLAWAITVHKSQGMSLDIAEVDLSKSFEGLFLKGLNEMALRINEEVLEFDNKFKDLSKTNSFHIKTMGEEKLNKMHQDFAQKIKGEKPKEKKLDTISETKKMLDEGISAKNIAKERGLKLGTILDHIEKIKEADPKYNIYNLQNSISKTKFKEIYNAFHKIGVSEGERYKLAPVKELLGPKYSYDDLRLVRLFL